LFIHPFDYVISNSDLDSDFGHCVDRLFTLLCVNLIGFMNSDLILLFMTLISVCVHWYTDIHIKRKRGKRISASPFNHSMVSHLDTFEAIKTRRSIRVYQDKPVEAQKLEKILEAGRLSPSAVNFQPWDFIVVKDEAAKTRLYTAYDRPWIQKAPLIIVVCATPQKAWKRRDGEEFWKIDAAIATQTMLLAAAAEGLGTCWIGAFDEEKVKQALGIPADVRVVAMTPLGYADEQKGPVVERKRLAEILHYDKW
jgi:nitroreductase